jgi:hypothetical protein
MMFTDMSCCAGWPAQIPGKKPVFSRHTENMNISWKKKGFGFSMEQPDHEHRVSLDRPADELCSAVVGRLY